MRIAILHQSVLPDAPPEELDVLVQVEEVCRALSRLGHEPLVFACSLNLQQVKEFLQAANPDRVFNLVESLGGSDALVTAVPCLLESLHLPYTGSSAAAIAQSTHKLTAKRLLRASGLATPDWVEWGQANPEALRSPFVVKAIWEHASFVLDDNSVALGAGAEDPAQWIARKMTQTGRPFFAERYIEGREFNVSVLGGDKAEVLPAAEIRFRDFPPGKPRVVGYRAKWEPDSLECLRTVRCFEFPDEDRALIERLGFSSLRAWEVFGLSGWARVDFRVDEKGQPWILEVNCNPCLSPDAGFVAACQRAGILFDTVCERILSDCAGTGKGEKVRFSQGLVEGSEF
ncbi:MAG: D-alanine--D-alanine ligase [Candidatus Omnitrophica bacterium]|nr:D-alanine--D-alanine ligase [Candidatus Omnitrophota bacterium]